MAQSERSTQTPFFADPNDELPVSVQLSWRLRALIATGRLMPGDLLPSVRRLAEWAGVNVNTVRAVYQGLEEEGLCNSRHGLGTFVSEGVTSSPQLEEIAANALAEAREAGATPRELAVVAMVCATVPAGLAEGVPPAELDDPGEVGEAELPDPELSSDELRIRRELRRQIARLEGELAAYVRELEVQDAGASRAESHIAGVAELERTRDLLMRQLSEARSAAARRGRQEGAARSRREAMLSNPGAHRWEVVSDAEMGEPGCRTYEVEPRYGPLGALMNWWRVKVSGGCPLAEPREAASRS